MTAALHRRRAIPRAAALPVSIYDDPYRRAAMHQVAIGVLDLAGRVIDELIIEATNPGLTPDERRGLVAIALQVDARAAARTGTPARTMEVATRGWEALGCKVAS